MHQSPLPTNPEKPWYHYKWVWFVISLPLLAVVAGIITFQIASNNADTLVKDDYFKQGLAINRALNKEQLAKSMAFTTSLIADQENKLLTVILQSHHDQTALNQQLKPFTRLKLLFSHPTLAKQDHQVNLDQLNEGEYVGELPDLPPSFWHIQLSDRDETWLVKSRWHYPQTSRLDVNLLQ